MEFGGKRYLYGLKGFRKQFRHMRQKIGKLCNIAMEEIFHKLTKDLMSSDKILLKWLANMMIKEITFLLQIIQFTEQVIRSFR